MREREPKHNNDRKLKKEKQSRAAAADVATAARTVAVVVGIANLSANAIGICNEYLNKRTNTHTRAQRGNRSKRSSIKLTEVLSKVHA